MSHISSFKAREVNIFMPINTHFSKSFNNGNFGKFVNISSQILGVLWRNLNFFSRIIDSLFRREYWSKVLYTFILRTAMVALSPSIFMTFMKTGNFEGPDVILISWITQSLYLQNEVRL
jgi:hypothetical protein